jgi:hypothetical protein
VDHHATALPGYQQAQQQHWRRAALITAGIAAVELVVLVVVALAFIAKPLADDGKRTSAKPQAAEQVKPEDGKGAAGAELAKKASPVAAELPRTATPVLVLNGNGIGGAAGDVAKRVRALDYPIAGVGDASRHDFPRTIVMYRPGLEGEGQRLAQDLHLDLRRAVPLDGMRPGTLGSAKLVLIVGG